MIASFVWAMEKICCHSFNDFISHVGFTTFPIMSHRTPTSKQNSCHLYSK